MGEREIQRMAPMAARYTRPDWVRRIDAMGDSVGGGAAGARLIVPLDADEMLEEARASLAAVRLVISRTRIGSADTARSCGGSMRSR